MVQFSIMKTESYVIPHPSFPIVLRFACEKDEEFYYQVYKSTRIEEISLWGWDANQIEQFLRFQYNVRSVNYRAQFGDADFYIVENDGQSIGVFTACYSDKEILGVDIALLPEWKGMGIGTSIILEFCNRAKERSLPFRIHVERQNVRAYQLYVRLGFEVTEENDAYIGMEWRSEP